jgi:hypothetical protein
MRYNFIKIFGTANSSTWAAVQAEFKTQQFTTVCAPCEISHQQQQVGW